MGVERGNPNSSDGDDRRYFWGFEIFDSGIILDGSSSEGIFWGDIQNNLRIRGSARVSWPHWG